MSQAPPEWGPDPDGMPLLLLAQGGLLALVACHGLLAWCALSRIHRFACSGLFCSSPASA
jgi:hypothetical protein